METPATDGGRVSRELPDGVVADLIGDEERRRALEILARRETPVVIDDLAVDACAGDGGHADELSPPERRRRRGEFFQRHLPKLTATEVVRYDSMLGTVELARRDAVAAALEET